MFFQADCYSKTGEVRVRPVPEMGICFVYTPATPRLYTLNTSAWLVLALCDGRTGEALVDAYAESMSTHLSREQAFHEICTSIDDLEAKGIVTHASNTGDFPPTPTQVLAP